MIKPYNVNKFSLSRVCFGKLSYQMTSITTLYTFYRNVTKCRYVINGIYPSSAKCRCLIQFINHFVGSASPFRNVSCKDIYIPLHLHHFVTFPELGICISLYSGKQADLNDCRLKRMNECRKVMTMRFYDVLHRHCRLAKGSPIPLLYSEL